MTSRIKVWFLALYPNKYKPVTEAEKIDWVLLKKKIGCPIINKDLFLEAFRHRSHQECSGPEAKPSNERLEFLGDAIVNFCIGEFVFREFTGAPEGDLTKMRSTLVSREYMAKKGKELEIGQFMLLGEGEERSGGRSKNSILSNALEAIIGAIYLDTGMDSVRDFLNNTILLNYREILVSEGNNYKGDLLEYLQKNHLPSPKYVTKKESGPDHKRIYTVAVKVGQDVLGTGIGKNKKTAEQEAARLALKTINSG